MAKVKILFTIPNFDTAGSGKALLNLVKGLDNNLYEPHIMCLHTRGDFFKTVEASGYPIHVYHYLNKARPITTLLSGCWRVSRKFKSIKPDIIHSFNYSADYSEGLAAKLAGIPWVFTKKNMGWGGASKNAWLLRSWLATKIVVQNTDMIKQFYPKSKKVYLIPRGVDVNHFSLNLENSKESNAFRYIICVANMVPVKGIELLIEAFNTLKGKYSNWHLLLVGDVSNPYGNMLKEQVRILQLEDIVTFTGKVLDVRPYIHQAEVFVLPTKNEGRREGSPVALLEAMACGKVVLGSNIPGIKDQLIEFPEALFKAGDVTSLTLKLDSLLSLSKQDLQKKGLDYRVLVEKCFEMTQEVHKHEKLYKSVVN
ncbi:glycosyltransferase [Mangrovimonas spongiae]|nr:glycosyltransferase [Mangrovimonas spongiae]